MKKLLMITTCLLLLAGCQSQGVQKGSQPTSPNSAEGSNTPTAQVNIPQDTMKLPSSDELILLKKTSDHSAWTLTRKGTGTDKTIQVSHTTNNGEAWLTADLPITQDWERGITEKSDGGQHIFTSLNENGPSWILFTSGPAGGMMIKTLYKTGDAGKTWVLVGDITPMIEGYVKGMTFVNDNNGWIGSEYRGTTLVPLYQTKDGGKTWSKQNIPLLDGYRYGNVSAPVFDSSLHGTLEIEFVGDTNKKVIKYETKDGGQSWNKIQ